MLGVSMVGMWHSYNVGSLPPLGLLVKKRHYLTLPFTLTLILFIQTLSPMVISIAGNDQKWRGISIAGNQIAFGILFVTVFLRRVVHVGDGHDEAEAMNNISGGGIAKLH